MKLINGILMLVIICICSFTVYGIGYTNGERDETTDDVYARYLREIFPDDENEFTYIVLRDDDYHVLHNQTWDEHESWKKNLSYYWNLAICSEFDGHTIWHEPGGSIVTLEDGKFYPTAPCHRFTSKEN